MTSHSEKPARHTLFSSFMPITCAEGSPSLMSYASIERLGSKFRKKRSRTKYMRITNHYHNMTDLCVQCKWHMFFGFHKLQKNFQACHVRNRNLAFYRIETEDLHKCGKNPVLDTCFCQVRLLLTQYRQTFQCTLLDWKFGSSLELNYCDKFFQSFPRIDRKKKIFK